MGDCFSNIPVGKLLECVPKLPKMEVLTEDEIKFLRSRVHRWKIHDDFQNFLDEHVPGTWIVPVCDDELNNALMRMDKIFAPILGDRVVIRHMEDSMCHDNCEILQSREPDLVWYIGWVLSEDARWRSHSWMVDVEGNVIETTEERLIYLGCVV